MTKIKKIFSGVTALTLALTCGCGLSMTASASLKEGDSKAYRGTGYLAKYEVLSVEKDGKTTVKVTLKNTSKRKINNWAVGFDEAYWRVEDVKYGRLFSSEYSYNTVIRDCGTNGSVAPNECVSFSFTMADNYVDLPERLKVYSDINKSNTVEELNTAAKNCYNAISELLADEETMGTPIDECFKNGLFANSNSKGGMKTGFNYKYKEIGDKVINAEASQYARGNISVYVGRTTYDGEDGVFVQVKDNKTGKVGQFPHPIDGTAEWTAFDPSSPIYTNYSSEDVNRAAKWAYNAVAEYQAYKETKGLDFLGSFENGSFRQANSMDGLKIGFSGSLAEGDKAINEELSFNYEGIIIYAGKMGSDGDYEYFVQAKDPRTGKVGQYPHPTQGEATWGTFDTNTPLAPVIFNQKTVNGDAKTAYNAVAEYFADLETQGYDLLECYNNGCFAKASTKEGLKTGQEDSLSDGDKAIENELKSNCWYYENLTVYVGLISDSKDKNGDINFFVQVKDPTGRVGQYPDPTNDSATWGTHIYIE